MQISNQHALGCSVIALHGMHTWALNLNPGGWDPEYVAMNTVAGIKAAKRYFKNLNRGGVVIWADSSAGELAHEAQREWEDTDGEDAEEVFEICSGAALYRHLKKAGENVGKTASYKNPFHRGSCTVYHWLFRNKKSRRADGGKYGRPTKAARRKKMVKKTKAAAKRATAKRI